MRFFKRFLPFICLIILGNNSFSQSTGIGTASPDASALLELKSTTKGLLIPRMTVLERTSIANPAEGLLVYQNDTDTGFYYFSGFQWRRLSVNSALQPNISGRNIFLYMKKYEGFPRPPEEIWIANFDGTEAHKIPIPDSLKINDDACLSPDGEFVFFNVTDTSLGGVTNIYSCNLDGSNLRRVASAGLGFDFEVRTAAGVNNLSVFDSSYIFFSREPVPDQHQIWRINLDGTNEQMLNITLPGDYMLNVDSDGGQITVLKSRRKILFKARSNNFGYSSLFTCSYDGTNVQKIVDRIGTSFGGN